MAPNCIEVSTAILQVAVGMSSATGAPCRVNRAIGWVCWNFQRLLKELVVTFCRGTASYFGALEIFLKKFGVLQKKI
jgi:hypothetical protein